MDPYGRPLGPPAAQLSPQQPAPYGSPPLAYQSPQQPAQASPYPPQQQPAYYQAPPQQASLQAPPQQQPYAQQSAPQGQPTSGGAAPGAAPQAPANAQQGAVPVPAGYEPGFFAKLFGGSDAKNTPGGSNAPAPVVKVVEEAETANCLPSKPLTAEEIQQIRSKPLGKSIWPCLNGEATAASAPGPGQEGVVDGPPLPPPKPIVSPDVHGPPPEVNMYGPWLKFVGYDPVSVHTHTLAHTLTHTHTYTDTHTQAGAHALKLLGDHRTRCVRQAALAASFCGTQRLRSAQMTTMLTCVCVCVCVSPSCCSQLTRHWSGSVLVLVHQARCPSPPTLRFKDADARVEATVQAAHLDHYQGWNFW